jgi:hypothetical protein
LGKHAALVFIFQRRKAQPLDTRTLLVSLSPPLFFFSKRLGATVFGKKPQAFARRFSPANTTQR